MCFLLKKMTFLRDSVFCVLMAVMASSQASEQQRFLDESLSHSETVQGKGYTCLLSPWLERVPDAAKQEMAGLKGREKEDGYSVLDVYRVKKVGDDAPLDLLFGSLEVSCLQGKAGDYPELHEKDIKDADFIRLLGQKYKEQTLREWTVARAAVPADGDRYSDPSRIMGFIRPHIEKVKGRYVLATGYFRSVPGMLAPVKVVQYAWYEGDRLYQVTQTCLEVKEAVWSVFFNQTMGSFQFDKGNK